MNGDATDPANGLPSLPAEVHDQLLTILFGDARQRDDELARLLARAAELADAIAAHVAWHDAQADRGTSPSDVTGAPEQAGAGRGPWTPDARRDGGPAPGSTFGDFRIERQLGHGGMGDVFLAQQLNLDRKVALKVIRGDRAMDAAARERFRREARAVANLRHPGICAVLEVGEVGDTPFLAMQYVDGESLATRLATQRARTGALPSTGNDVRAVLQMGVRLAEALHAAHEAGVVHRDVKPGNVMIDGRGEPVLLDFGLARELTKPASDATLTLSGVAIGTPPYMSPEQIRSRGTVDRRTDVYSLAVTLFECLTLHRPFQAHDPLTLCEQIERDPTPDPRRSNPHLPVDLTAVLAKAMEKDPARRYATALEFAADLQRICRGEPVRARRIGGLGRGWRWARRHPLAAGLVASLMAGLFTTTYLLHRSEEQARALQATSDQLTARTREFGMLADGVLLENLRADEAVLHPAWPELTERMSRWLDVDLARLSADLPQVTRTIAELEQRALPLSPVHEARIAAMPEHAQLVRARSEHAAILRWRALRAGQAFEVPELPEWLQKARLGEVATFAWQRLRHTEAERSVFGEEAVGLAAALRARELLRGGAHLVDEPDWQGHAIAAWGWFFNGQIEKARTELAELRSEQTNPEIVAQLDVIAAMVTKKDLQWAGKHGDELLARTDVFARDLRLRLERGVREFADPADQFLYRCLVKIEADFEDFRRVEVAAVERRLHWSKRVEALTTSHPRARVSWREAIECIRQADDVVASRAYGELGTRLRPQLDLVPLGMNPQTKLWEFYHLPSAHDPAQGGDPGEIVIPTLAEVNERGGMREGYGIVFVLLPGGQSRMGAQRDRADEPHHDAYARSIESPVHMVSLDPFFLAKHELTQGQWMRLSAGPNPSHYAVGFRTEHVLQAVSLAHPVETVDWPSCVRLLEVHGLTLPTEAQWEYGCRAGTSSPWSTGDDVADLEGAANVFDRRFKQIMGSGPTPAPIDDDGFVIHAPVGSLAPNAFGLFDMHGNVWEWCGDRYGSYEFPLAPGTGARQVPFYEDWPARRGGSFDCEFLDTRSSSRLPTAPTMKTSSIGLRAARLLRQ